MIAILLDALSWACLLVGGGFVITGGIGILRMPDVYTRAHAASLTDMAGAALMLAGLMVQAGPTLLTIKLVFILVFLWATSPVSTHALINAAFSAGLKPILAEDKPAAPAAPKEAPSSN
jgi:multicomponent Na+:H+ antiporter subunit G